MNLSKSMVMCAATLLAACATTPSDNPLLGTFDTPFQTPPFDKIKLEHLKPAFSEAMKQQKAEIDSIANNPEAPTFDNTIGALDRSGRLMERVGYIFSCLNENVSDDALRAISQEITPVLTEHNTEMSLNEKVFERVKNLYDRRDSLQLNAQQLRTLTQIYNDYVRQGAALPADKKLQMKEINTRLAMATLKFGENMLKESKSFQLIIDKKEDLAGIPENFVAAAAQEATAAGLQGKWLFTTDKPSLLPFLQYADNRELRKQIYMAYYHRADNGNANDNKAVINEIVKLRTQRAQLLGFHNYAEYATANNMAQTPENVYNLLLQLWRPGIAQAKIEMAELQQIADREGKGVKIEGWDWWYYAEKLRKEKYDLDETALKPYLGLDNVREGMFWVANRLYGISFVKHTDIPVYAEGVETYEVLDKDSSHLAILYLDYYPRDGKGAGAWCSNLRSYHFDDGKEIFPLVTISCNFSKPVGDKPAQLSWDEAETLFHEFGHAIAGFFGRGEYGRIAGYFPYDMVELPSQVMENWLAEPEVLKHFARNSETGEVIPDALIEKIRQSSHFNQGWATSEHMASALLDMDWYVRTDTTDVDVDQFERETLKKYGLIDQIYPRYRSTIFSHIFNGGYAAGYYVYTWAAVLDSDAFAAFKESGDIFNPEIAARFRQYVLTESGYDEGMVQYRKFRGADPSVKPLLEKRGFATK